MDRIKLTKPDGESPIKATDRKKIMSQSTITLKDLRKSHKLTQYDVAKYLDRSQANICQYERGVKKLDSMEITRLFAELYRCSVITVITAGENSYYNATGKEV